MVVSFVFFYWEFQETWVATAGERRRKNFLLYSCSTVALEPASVALPHVSARTYHLVM